MTVSPRARVRKGRRKNKGPSRMEKEEGESPSRKGHRVPCLETRKALLEDWDFSPLLNEIRPLGYRKERRSVSPENALWDVNV